MNDAAKKFETLLSSFYAIIVKTMIAPYIVLKYLYLALRTINAVPRTE